MERKKEKCTLRTIELAVYVCSVRKQQQAMENSKVISFMSLKFSVHQSHLYDLLHVYLISPFPDIMRFYRFSISRVRSFRCY